VGFRRQKHATAAVLVGLLFLGVAGCGGPGPHQRSDELRVLESGLSRTEWNRYRLTHPETH
jgi:hypothetical protein